METHQKNARMAGILFLTAMVSSLLGGGLIESVLGNAEYLTHLTPRDIRVIAGIFLEIINGVAVIGIAVVLLPVLKQQSEALALGYIGLRIIESLFCLAAALIPIVILALSQNFGEAGVEDTSGFYALGTALMGTRSQLAGFYIPISFSAAAMLFYSMLLRSKLIPVFISIWGLIGALLVIALNVSNSTNVMAMLLVLPMILNEIFLGIWLIVKGFSSQRSVNHSLS